MTLILVWQAVTDIKLLHREITPCIVSGFPQSKGSVENANLSPREIIQLQRNLSQKLLSNYEKTIRPQLGAVDVTYDIAVNQVLDLVRKLSRILKVIF